VNEFKSVAKLGEGSFGEAFKVISNRDGNIYAVKKTKQKYIGVRDREQKLSEVYKSLKISNFRKTQPDDAFDFGKYCVKTYEAWEESGNLFIRSELCERGNLNDYLVELEK
jgi:membrane-associated tyrosine- and threonine-specific cdc2-inhibitory kinase